MTLLMIVHEDDDDDGAVEERDDCWKIKMTRNLSSWKSEACPGLVQAAGAQHWWGPGHDDHGDRDDDDDDDDGDDDGDDGDGDGDDEDGDVKIHWDAKPL